jgi:hypothetical protein
MLTLAKPTLTMLLDTEAVFSHRFVVLEITAELNREFSRSAQSFIAVRFGDPTVNDLPELNAKHFIVFFGERS